MEDVPLSGEGIEQAGRANLRFNFAGSKELDLVLPWVLIAGSVIWIFLQAHRTNRTDAGWITFTSSIAWLAVYIGIISPITFAMIRQAGKMAGFQLPRTARFRALASFMPALVLTASLWMLGHGAFASVLMGALGGVLVAMVCVWILFRLQPEEIAMTAGLSATGYLIGLVISGALLMGLNTLSRSIVDATQTSAIPISPFGSGFNWQPVVKGETAAEAAARRNRSSAAERADPNANRPAPVIEATPTGPPPVTTELAASARSAAVATITALLPTEAVADLGPIMPAPTSPLVVSFSPASSMRSRVDAFIFPLTASPFVATKTIDGDMLKFECWDSRTWTRVGNQPIAVKANQATGDYVISPDGQKLARVATFIRREIEIYSFAAPTRKPEMISLDENAGAVQTLVGFLPAEPDGLVKSERLMISVETGGKMFVNAYDLSRKAPMRLRPLELPLADGGRACMAITSGAKYFAMVGKHTDRNVPAVRFFSMNAERLVTSHEAQIGDLPSGWSTTPVGFAVSNDSTENDTLAAALFEHPGGAIIYTYKQVPGVKVGEFIDRAGELQKPAAYTGPPLIWLGSGRNRYLLVYGTIIIDMTRSEVIGRIDLSKIRDAKAIGPATLLITSETDRHPIPARVELKLDGSANAR
jgi:hypothetical protein